MCTACTRWRPQRARIASSAAKASAESTSSGPTPTTMTGAMVGVLAGMAVLSVMTSSWVARRGGPAPPLFAAGGRPRRAVGPEGLRQRALLPTSRTGDAGSEPRLGLVGHLGVQVLRAITATRVIVIAVDGRESARARPPPSALLHAATIYPLEDAVAAYDDLAHGRVTGRASSC